MVDLRELLAEALGDRYRVARELTGGGMSRVFLAEELALSREVVVKVLSPDLVGAQHFERFRGEILQTARLQHPSIVPMLSVGTLQYPNGATAPYYIMPYIRGETLRSRLGREGPFSASSLLRVLRDVLEALVHAHLHGVIHRDIKPENIFISGGHAVVTDFGIAKALSAAGDSPGSTLPGVAVGTPAYMSPEQAAGDDGVDHRSDLYALGVVAYELLTGRAPFAGQSTRQVIVAHVRSNPEPLSRLRPDLPPVLAEAVMRCMEKEPDRRWRSADELLRVLEEIRPSDPSMTRSREVVVPARSGHRRWAALAGIGAVAAVSWTLVGRPAPAEPSGSESLMVLTPDLQGDSVLHHLLKPLQMDVIHHLRSLGFSVKDAHATDGMDEVPPQEQATRLGAAFVVTLRLAADAGAIRSFLNLNDKRMTVVATRPFVLDPADPRQALELLADSAAHYLEGVLPASVRAAEVAATDPLHARRLRLAEVIELVQRADSASRTRTRSGLLAALDLLGQATALDPRDAVAHAALSDTYSLFNSYGYRGPAEPYPTAARALAHANHAIGLDPTVDRGYWAKAYLLWQVNAPQDSVRAAFEAGLDLNPAGQPSWYSMLLMREGLKDSALAEARRGVENDPNHPGRRINLAWDAFGLGEDQLAVQEADSAVARAPDLEYARGLLVRSLLAARNYTRCAREPAGQYQGTRAACLDAARRHAEAKLVLDSLFNRFITRDSVSTPSIPAQELAIYFAARGESRATMFWVRESFRQSPWGMVWVTPRSHIFDLVRDASFTAELETLERQVYPRVAGEAGQYLRALTSGPAN